MRRIPLLRAVLGGRKGVAAIEFALTFPIFVAFAFGLIEVGRYVAAQQALMYAVYQGGRYAAVHGSSSTSPATTKTIQTQVGNNLGFLTPSSVTTNVTNAGGTPGTKVTITSTYSWVPVAPFLNLPTATISATSNPTILN
jgi:Flp pilus assembly protein TadG